MHPASRLLSWLSPVDFALLDHGYKGHGRDYYWRVQDSLGPDPGEHEIVFTHCVESECRTRVGDDILAVSWDDVFTDYDRWLAAGEPDGYVWGSNWSMAYPGVTVVEGSKIAASWSTRVGKLFHEITLETDRWLIRLVFHGIRHRKLSETTGSLSGLIIPLPGPEAPDSNPLTPPPPP